MQQNSWWEGANCLEKLKQAVDLTEATADTKLKAEVYRMLGNVASDLANHHQARTYYQQSLEICRQVGNDKGAGEMYVLSRSGFFGFDSRIANICN